MSSLANAFTAGAVKETAVVLQCSLRYALKATGEARRSRMQMARSTWTSGLPNTCHSGEFQSACTQVCVFTVFPYCIKTPQAAAWPWRHTTCRINLAIFTVWVRTKARAGVVGDVGEGVVCLLYTSPSPRDRTRSRMPSSA